MNDVVARRVAAVGLMLQFALVAGMSVAIAGMMRANARVHAAKNEAEMAVAITGAFAHGVRAIAITAPIALAGLILLVLMLRNGSLRGRWIFRATLAALCVWLLVVPVGTIIGIVGLCLLIPRRKEFGNKGEPAGTDNSGAAPLRR